jgi:hypothetical protein
MWNLVSAYLQIVLIRTQDWCKVCAERTIGSEIIWSHLMEHIGEVGHVYPRFGLFGDSVHVGARYVHGLRHTYHRLSNHFGCTRWNS